MNVAPRILEWAALVFALLRAIYGDTAGTAAGVLLAIYIRVLNPEEPRR